MEQMVTVYLLGKKYSVPATLTIRGHGGLRIRNASDSNQPPQILRHAILLQIHPVIDLFPDFFHFFIPVLPIQRLVLPVPSLPTSAGATTARQTIHVAIHPLQRRSKAPQFPALQHRS